MVTIGGNITAQLQIKSTTKNEIGERIPTWTTIHNIQGFLDLSSGEAKSTSYNAKVQESTHLFICDYFPLDSRISAENSRLLVGTDKYDVTLIDNPMGLNYQFEIFLKFTGGVVNG